MSIFSVFLECDFKVLDSLSLELLLRGVLEERMYNQAISDQKYIDEALIRTAWQEFIIWSGVAFRHRLGGWSARSGCASTAHEHNQSDHELEHNQSERTAARIQTFSAPPRIAWEPACSVS